MKRREMPRPLHGVVDRSERFLHEEKAAMDCTCEDVAKMIDHSLLNPTLTTEKLEAGIQTALDYDVASACIMPHLLRKCAERLKGSNVKASTTIGFPHGGHTMEVKLAETRQALEDGGEELDMVVNISRVLSADWDYVGREIKAITGQIHEAGQKIKVIFENCYLTDAQKVTLCEICGEIGVDWVKTSTGYGTGGATMADLRLMRKHSPTHVQVKAAGGVRDLATLLEVRALGVTRVGCSRTAEILEECRRQLV